MYSCCFQYKTYSRSMFLKAINYNSELCFVRDSRCITLKVQKWNLRNKFTFSLALYFVLFFGNVDTKYKKEITVRHPLIKYH